MLLVRCADGTIISSFTAILPFALLCHRCFHVQMSLTVIMNQIFGAMFAGWASFFGSQLLYWYGRFVRFLFLVNCVERVQGSDLNKFAHCFWKRKVCYGVPVTFLTVNTKIKLYHVQLIIKAKALNTVVTHWVLVHVIYCTSLSSEASGNGYIV